MRWSIVFRTGGTFVDPAAFRPVPQNARRVLVNKTCLYAVQGCVTRQRLVQALLSPGARWNTRFEFSSVVRDEGILPQARVLSESRFAQHCRQDDRENLPETVPIVVGTERREGQRQGRQRIDRQYPFDSPDARFFDSAGFSQADHNADDASPTERNDDNRADKDTGMADFVVKRPGNRDIEFDTGNRHKRTLLLSAQASQRRFKEARKRLYEMRFSKLSTCG